MKNYIIKYIIAAILFLPVSQLVFAQHRISGTVKNNNGEAIPFASISLKANGEGTKTDSAGVFNLPTTAKGKQVLLVTSVGYKPLKKEITIADSSVYLDLILLQSDAQS